MNTLTKKLIKSAEASNAQKPAINAEWLVELVVAECTNLLMSPDYIGRSDLDWEMVLKEHFGIKNSRKLK